MAELKGIDISRHQGQVNWDAIQRDVGFVIIRAGYGGGGVDDQLVRNRDEARRRGIPRQFYFYAYPGRSGGAAQADEFFSRVGPLQVSESVSLDIEDDPTYGRTLIPSDVQWCLDFLNRARERFGVKPLIYMNSNVKGRFNWQPVVAGDFGLWIANYGPNNGNVNARPDSAPWAFWALWQYTSRGSVGGISPVDVNIFSGDAAAFRKYGLQGDVPQPAPTPPATPTPPQPSAPPIAVDYAVKAGDTLSAIAGRYGMTYQQLWDFSGNRNRITDVNKIYAGQVIKVPGNRDTGAPPAAPAQTFHTVASGDTLSSIGAKYGTKWQTIYEWNKGVIGGNPNFIKPGQRLRVK